MPFPPGRRPNGPLRPTDRRPGAPGRPASPAPSQAMAIHGEMMAAQLARSVANGQRYLVALRADQAYDRLARQDGQYHLPRGTQRYLGQLRHPLSPAWLGQHAQPTAFVGPAATDLEKLQAHVRATNPSEIGFIMRHDPVVRTAGVAIVVVAGAEVAAAAYSALTWRAAGVFALKVGINATGQFAGNYLYSRDAADAYSKINRVSVVSSGFGVPLGANSLMSAGFSWNRTGFTTVMDGSITPVQFGRDAAFNYGFGKLAAGFKIPGKIPILGGRNWVGLDKLYQTEPMNYGLGFIAYQGMLRLSPRVGYGIGLGLSTGLEHGNKVVSGAAKKYLGNEVKKHIPGK